MILGGGWLVSNCVYRYKWGNEVIICACKGCKFWKIGANVWARCWYSGWNLIVLGIKYISCLLLWVVGCVLSMSGIGPGLG